MIGESIPWRGTIVVAVASSSNNSNSNSNNNNNNNIYNNNKLSRAATAPYGIENYNTDKLVRAATIAATTATNSYEQQHH
tara:strand:- start:420 stop:659 length:240 start_codon:yes stop_codon:yes gene_type:complete